MSVQLRVEFPGLPSVQSKAMRFNWDSPVSDACRLIRSHNAAVGALGSESDYGIHVLDNTEVSRRGYWLNNDRPLSFYKNLRPMSSVEYRKKVRPLRVKMMDGAVKTIMANDAAPVSTVIQQICERVGISNWESYSLVIEDPEDDKLGTIKRKESQAFRNAKKMEKLRSLLHTEDGVNWISHDKSLSEQGINEDTVLTLRVKFWGDSNIDRNDPVHLNLIFAEARDSIIQGTHPVTEELAVSFAAIHAQEQFGNYDASRGKSLTPYLKECLPPDYRKARGIDQRVVSEYAKLTGLSENNARFRYVDLFRSLGTFGVSFFLVKEKEPGKNRLVPSLLGIARESIMRVDAKTKVIQKKWPLTRVKDWAASTKAFTLNFGDHTDSVYSVQTLEGETISQLIGGYIDILLKKRQELENRVVDDAAAEMVAAESIVPGHATVTEYANNDPRHGSLGHTASFYEKHGGGDASHMLSPEGVHLSDSIHSVLTQIGTFLPEIQHILEDRALANDTEMASWHDGNFELHRQQLLTCVSNITAATAQLVLLTSVDPADVNYVAVEQSVSSISNGLERLLDTVRTIAYHLPDDLGLRDKILDAARNLMLSTQNMLNPLLPENNADRSHILQTVHEVGTAAGNLLSMFGNLCCDQAYQDELLALAYLVSLASRSLGKEVEHVAGECEDTVLKDSVEKGAKATTASGAELVTCTKAVASCLPAEVAKAQLLEAAHHVTQTAESAVNTSQDASYDSHLLDRVAKESSNLDHAVNAYLAKLNEGPRSAQLNSNGELCEAILAALDQMKTTVGTSAILKDMAISGKSVSRLVTSLRDQAQNLDDSDLSQRLMDGARQLTEATARLLEKVKVNTRDPSNGDAVEESIEDVKEVVWAVAGDDYRRLLLERLEAAARRACATSTQLTATSSAVADESQSEAEKQQLTEACQEVDDEAGALGGALKNLAYNPERAQAQLRLLTAAPGILQPGSQLIVTAKDAHALVQRDDLASDLLGILKSVARALSDLKAAIKAFSEVAGLLNLDAAMETIGDLVEVVNEDVDSIQRKEWQRDTTESLQSATAQLTEDTRAVSNAMAKLVNAAAQRNDVSTGQAAQSVADALTELVESSRNVAACCPTDRAGQEMLLTAVSAALSSTIGLLQAGRDTVTGAGGPDSKKDLVMAAKAVQDALANILGSLPHMRRMDAAIDRIGTSIVSDTVRSFQDAQNNFSDRAGALNQAVANLLEAARSGDMSLAEAAQRLAEDFLNMLNAAQAVDDASKSENSMLMAHAQGISEAAARLLEASKKLLAGGLDSPGLMSSLTAAAKGVTDSMNSLLTQALASPPGEKECEAAGRSITATGNTLDMTDESAAPTGYFQCQRAIQEKAMALNTAMNSISNDLRASRLDDVQAEAPLFGANVNSITKAAAQCAHIVGMGSPFSAPLYAIRAASARLQDPSCEGRQLLPSTTEINKQTAIVRATALELAERSSNPAIKHFYMGAAKEVTGLTAAVVQSVTKLATEASTVNRDNCAVTSEALISAVEKLVAYSVQPPGTTPPSPSASSQVPVLSPARSLVSSSAQYMHTASGLCKDSSSDSKWQDLSKFGRDVSNALMRLLEDVLSNAPGQQECDSVMDMLKDQIVSVDQALVGAISRTLKPIKEVTLEAYQEQIMGALIGLHDGVEPLAAAAKTDPLELARRVTAAGTPFRTLCPDVVGAASNIVDHKSQLAVLESCKSLLESMLQLVSTAKKSGGNAEATSGHPAVTSAANATRSAIQKLSAEIESAASSSSAVTSVVEGVEEAMMMLEQPLSEHPGGSFQEFAEGISQSARSMTADSQKLISKSSSQPEIIPDVMSSLGDRYQDLVSDSRKAMAVAEQEEVSVSLCRSSKALGQCTTRLLLASAAVQGDPSDMNAKRGLAAAARMLSEKVSDLLSVLQAGSRGVEACIEAIQELSGVISEIETNIYFVSAGSLLPDDGNDTFAKHRDAMLYQTKQLIDHVKQLMLGAATSSEQLALEAEAIVATSHQLAESSRGGAAALGSNDKEGQTSLLEACKSVASSLSDLLNSSKNASGKPPTSAEMEALRLEAKSIMKSIAHFMGTVKSCDSEAGRGTRALQQACQRISEQIELMHSPASPGQTATADELIQSSKVITQAVAKLQHAGRSKKREDAVVAADVASRSVVEVLTACRAASASAETPEAQRHCLSAGQQCGEAFVAMLRHIIDIMNSPTPEKNRRLPEFSKNIAISVNALVKAAEMLKSGYVNPDDPNVIAERELRAAAASIEAASRKLAQLKPRESARMADESLTFDEQILEAAKAIALATSALIKWATATQRELVAQGRVNTGGSAYISSEDNTWSQGLVSAAKMVAGTTSQLCEAANLLVQGHAKEEKLIAAAKGVSQSTIQLLMACQVKADVDSESAEKLQDAGKAVERASANLVRVASDAARRSDEAPSAPVAVPTTAVQRIKAELELREMITEQERALEAKRAELEGLHKHAYSKSRRR